MSTVDDVRGILRKIPRGVVFDSHFVIWQLNKGGRYTLATERFVRGRMPTERAHGYIAQVIRDFAERGELIERMQDLHGRLQSWSLNMRFTPSRCSIWRRMDAD